MADDQTNSSTTSATTTLDEATAEAQERKEKRAILQTVFNELRNDFKARAQEGVSFSINLDYNSDTGASQDGKHNDVKGWEVGFEFRPSDTDKDFEYKVDFDVKSTVVSSSSDKTHSVGAGNMSIKLSEDNIFLKFYYGEEFKLIKLVDIEKNEVKGDRIELSFKNRTLNSEISEVWFPASDSQNAALQRPIKLNTEDKNKWLESRLWPEIEETNIKVGRPKVELKGEEQKISAATLDGFWKVAQSVVTYWTVGMIYSGNRLVSFLDNGGSEENLKERSEDYWGLPPKHLFEPVRPVNLNPSDVLSDLEDKGLHFPWHVIESACAALNAGKNVIFTGPPGCGKSKLASFLAKKATGQPPLMATASPAWTSGDLIGRYMPARNGKGLIFREGFLLRAVPQSGVSKWLIIDEFNRADIDSCFGELFSVLAGDAVQLPFEKLIESDEEQGEGEEKVQSTSFVRIVPAAADDVEEQAGDYRVPRRFRLIGTMNDADRSGLNSLSFALMRRFAFIPVEAPQRDKIVNIINKEINEVNESLGLKSRSWHVVGTRISSLSGRCKIKKIIPELESLFCGQGSQTDDLISTKSVGISIVQDVIRLVGEGMRSVGSENENRHVDFREIGNKLPSDGNGVKRDKTAEMLVLSYLALALVLQVFPQLESLEQSGVGDNNELKKAIKHIFWSMHVEVDPGSELRMLRIAKSDEGSKYERVLKSDQTIAEFLFENLKTRLPNLDTGRLRNELEQEGWL